MINSRIFVFLIILLLPFNYIKGQDHAGEFEYLIDSHPGTIDNAMKDSGYRFVRTDREHGNSIQYWWNADENQCVSIEVDNSRVIAVLNVSEGECYQTDDTSDSYQSNYIPGPGNFDAMSVAYDRGYTDGLRNRSFENNYFSAKLQKSAYTNGYSKGVKLREQGEQNSLSAIANYRKLEGVSVRQAYAVLQNDGFQEVLSHQLGGNSYRTWFNNTTGQCINTVIRSGYVNEILISAHCLEN
ncbi:hypothetical protein E7Z59_09590 [Robertkochia marina]|uniref:Uncharacterized protein n=1 Tax=Robertkochia marina TaxID=1227945 RepID=A0A4S3M0F7_9FLAO|nr:hypothetical protein [Robertkochia marina]THD67892.1 hypothetical protein E7Z59_09590 [Robertkochia marina]TRZ42069.1 hypothetical protein D3A96_12125 [Robertkochia marina]